MAHVAVWEAPQRLSGLRAGRKFARLAGRGAAHALSPDRPEVTLCNRYAHRFDPMGEDFEALPEDRRCRRCWERLAGATV